MDIEIFETPITYKNDFHFMKPMFVSWCSDLISPKTYVEVGTWKMGTFEYMNSKLPLTVKMVGFDLFEDAPIEEIAPEKRGLSYNESLDMVRRWDREVVLVKGDTVETLSDKWLSDLLSPVVVYLDGGHSYETVKSDFWNLYEKLDSGLIILDDWVDPTVLGKGLNKYNHIYSFDPNANFLFRDSTWKLAEELHQDVSIDVKYVFDIFNMGSELECLGVVVI